MKFRLVFAMLALLSPALHAQDLPRDLRVDGGVTVVVFLGLECPISQKYVPALNALANAYSGKDVRLRAVVPGKVKKSELRRFIREYRPAFPVSVDRKYGWVAALKATVTPEAFVLDDRSHVRYRGAIDDWFFELGGYRKAAGQTYLADAIDAVMRGENPAVKETNALGCSIEVPGGD